MKIIINESQLKLIVEDEGEDSLIDFTPFYNSGIPPVEWDDMFLLIKGKKAKKGDKTYDGYYINGDVDLSMFNDITELKYLVKVRGTLDLRRTPIKSLPMLKYVGLSLYLSHSQIESLAMLSYVEGYLSLYNSQIESLPKLEYVGINLDLYNSQIESLPKLEYVGNDLYLTNTPLSKTTTEEELRKQINVEWVIYL
jgi:hypothetical protein